MRTLLLNNKQIGQRVQRIACQIFEDCYDEKEIIVAGISNSGFVFAKKLVAVLKKTYSLQITLLEVKVDKQKPLQPILSGVLNSKQLKNKVVVVVDDVLNSGKTLMYSLRPFLESDVKKIRTVLLVDRDHKRYPIAADYVGLTLSTTVKEHITVEFASNGTAVYLE